MIPVTDKKIQDHLYKKEFASAEALILKKMSRKEEEADAHYLLGVMQYFKGEVGAAIQSLQKSLAIDPKHTDSAICLSVLFNDIGKYDDAKKVFDLANSSVHHPRSAGESAIDKKFSIKHAELGDLYFRYRRWDEAIEEYGKAAILEPTNLEVRIRRAKCFAKKGFVSRAVQELQQLKNDHPSDAQVRIQLGLLHFSQGNVLDAEIEWETVTQIDPDNMDVRSYLEMAKQARVTSSSSNLL